MGHASIHARPAYALGVHLRRALILFALVLGLTALAASIAPAPDRERTSAAPPPPTPPATAVEEKPVRFRAPAPKRRPPDRRVPEGVHIVLTVRVSEPGEVTIPRLGRLANAVPGAPARFDLLAPPAGRYDVLFRPTVGEPSRVGTLVTKSER